MAYFLPSSIQKRLLRYALLQTGLLDTQALDLDNLDIALGKRNKIELKNVGLSTEKLTALLHLPEELRILSARSLLLRIVVPADIYNSPIVADVEGIDVKLVLDTSKSPTQKDSGHASRKRSFETTRSPQHRKTNRRMQSSPPYDPGGLADAYVPSTEDLAKSFLHEESLEEKRELETLYTSQSRQIDESVLSESSDEPPVGTGMALGLPAFLAAFLQGIADRFQVRIRNVVGVLELQIPSREPVSDGQNFELLSLALRIKEIDLHGLSDSTSLDSPVSGPQTSASQQKASPPAVDPHAGKRCISFNELSVELVTRAKTTATQLTPVETPSIIGPLLQPASPDLPNLASPTSTSFLHESRTSQTSQPCQNSFTGPSSGSQAFSTRSILKGAPSSATSGSSDPLGTGYGFEPASMSSDTTNDHENSSDPLEIQLGEDNVSWAVRRNQSQMISEDIWSSFTEQPDLAASMMIEDDVAIVPSREFVALALDDSSNSRPSTSSFSSDKRPQTLSRTSTESGDDLTQSKFFSPEEAESLYMSAVTERTTHSPDMRKLPGHWGFDEESLDELDSRILSESTRTLPANNGDEDPCEDATLTPRASSPVTAEEAAPAHISALHETDTTDQCAPSALPRDNTSDTAGNETDLVSRLILSITNITVWVPSVAKDNIESASVNTAPTSETRHRRGSSSVAGFDHHMPGAFLQYAVQSASVKLEASYMKDTTASLPLKEKTSPSVAPLDVSIGSVKAQIDASTVRLVYSALQAVRAAFNTQKSGKNISEQSTPQPESAQTAQSFKLDVSMLRAFLLNALSEDIYSSVDEATPCMRDITPEASNILVRCEIDRASSTVNINGAASDLSVGVGKVALGLGEQNVVSFGDGQADRTVPRSPDLVLDISCLPRTAYQKAQTRLELETRILNVDFDLQKFDETFEFFGGLSGVMELSASIMSGENIGSKASPTSLTSPRKGVRFEEAVVAHDDSPSSKISARLAGFDVRLADKACYMVLRSSAAKILLRETYVAAAIDTIRLSGPRLLAAAESPPVEVVLGGTRLEYMFTPRDTDLERLLSLLTPSRNKYENDDDILLDTLLLQRRKGAVLRLNVNSIDCEVTDWCCVDRFHAFGNAMSRLSAVTKYLPEDDKPGLLTLVRVQAIRAQLPVNPRFGSVSIDCKELQVAHIGLPALIALAIGTITAGRPGEAKIISDLVPVALSENLPMLMARMIGDEIEPALKVKLFNICIEYSIPTITLLTGLDATSNAEDVVDLAASVMLEYIGLQPVVSSPSPSTGSVISNPPPKKLSIDVLLHDCAVGLQPLNQACKGMLVLTNTHFTTIVPPEDTFEAILELRKASLHVSDNPAEVASDSAARVHHRTPTPLPGRVFPALAAQGFVSVSSIMSARAVVCVTESTDKKSRYVDVDLKDELFVLESCADSTQTLFAVLGGLSPPMPPSKEQRFQTEAMTVQDMLSSFTGDAFERPKSPGSTLFDMDETTLPDEDDFLTGVDMSESIYGPVDAIFDKEDGTFAPDNEPGEIEQSLLDEDPFVMPSSPLAQQLGDRELERDLRKQCSAAGSSPSQEIRPFYLTDKDIDKQRGSSVMLGAPYRFNTPAVAFPAIKAPQESERLPFQLRVRDVHVIWNLYDGYDWQRTRDAITEAVEEVESRAEARKQRRRRSADAQEDDESLIGDFLFNSIYIGVPANRDPQELRREINRGINDLASETDSYATSGISRPTNASSGQQQRSRARAKRLKLERSKTHKVAFELKGVSADILVFPSGSGEVQNSVDVRVMDFEIFDNMPTSTWRKFLTYYHDEENMREMMKPMIHLEMLNVRPVLELAATEIVLRVSVLPLRLHVDQDALDFITRFFDFKDEKGKTADSEAEQPFLQRVEVNTVNMCVDYKPKKVDYGGLRSGRTAEFKNFFNLEKAMIQLNHVIIYGIRGFDALHHTLNDIWQPDVIRHQLPGILSGLGPVSSLVSIGAGLRDVVAIPVREYRKDGRLVRSIQKGAVHFARNTTSELARFGAKMAVGTQTMLQGAETLLSSGSSSPPHRYMTSDQGWTDVEGEDEEREQRAVSQYADQPLGVLQGLKSARRHLERDLLTARDAFIAVQGEVLESGSAVGAAQAVARHAPTIVLRPVIGASRAIGQTLMGVGNQVDRGNVKRMEDKYKRS